MGRRQKKSHSATRQLHYGRENITKNQIKSAKDYLTLFSMCSDYNNIIIAIINGKTINQNCSDFTGFTE